MVNWFSSANRKKDKAASFWNWNPFVDSTVKVTLNIVLSFCVRYSCILQFFSILTTFLCMHMHTFTLSHMHEERKFFGILFRSPDAYMTVSLLLLLFISYISFIGFLYFYFKCFNVVGWCCFSLMISWIKFYVLDRTRLLPFWKILRHLLVLFRVSYSFISSQFLFLYFW